MTESVKKKCTIKKLFVSMAAGALIGGAGAAVVGAVADSVSPYKQAGRDQVQAARVLEEEAAGLFFLDEDHTVASRDLVSTFEKTCAADNPGSLKDQSWCLAAASRDLFKRGANNLAIAASPTVNVDTFALVGAGSAGAAYLSMAALALRNRQIRSKQATKVTPNC